MPDIVATRPASGAPIEAAWAAEAHDAIEGIQAGTVAVPINNDFTGMQTVTFPRAYAAPPQVYGCVSPTNTSLWFGQAASVTPTGFTARATHRDGNTSTTSISVAWVAVGTLATPGP